MNRIASISVGVLLVLGCRWAMGAEGSDPGLIPDPGFEQAGTGAPGEWRLPKPIYDLSTDQPRSGAWCLHYRNETADVYKLASVPPTLQHGRRYKFGVWVRTRDLAGDDTGATVCIEWSTADGTFIGGAYPAGVKGTVSEWTRVEGLTRPIPENAASYSLTCYVRKGMTGEAWFDDVSLQEFLPPLLEGVTTDRYRGAYVGGTATVVAGLTLDQQRLAPGDVTVSATVRDATGATVLEAAAQSIEARQARIAIDTDSLAVGTYDVEVSVRTRASERAESLALRLTRLATEPARKVWIDPHGRTIVDGVPFFPLGTYWSGIAAEHLKIYAASPFNCLMPYGRPTAEQMDLAHEHGLKVIYSIKDYYAGTRWAPPFIKDEADERPAVEAAVSAFRQHPALLAWYINDELPVDMVERLSRHQSWMEELDPDHPTWVVLYQVADVRRYLGSFDVIGTDPYPIPHLPASRALDWTRQTRAATFGRHAVWQVPQIFDWAAYKKGAERDEYRAPTLLEMRSMAWQCIAAGANGLVFYSWFDLWKMNERTPFAERWGEVTTMAEEIARLIPVLLSVDPVPPVSVNCPEDVAKRCWGQGDDTLLLLVNSAPEERRVRIALEPGVPRPQAKMGAVRLIEAADHTEAILGPLEPCMLKLSPHR